MRRRVSEAGLAPASEGRLLALLGTALGAVMGEQQQN